MRATRLVIRMLNAFKRIYYNTTHREGGRRDASLRPACQFSKAEKLWGTRPSCMLTGPSAGELGAIPIRLWRPSPKNFKKILTSFRENLGR